MIEQNQEFILLTHRQRNAGFVLHHNRIAAVRLHEMIKIGHVDQVRFVRPEEVVWSEQGLVFLKVGRYDELGRVDEIKRGVILIGLAVHDFLNVDRINLIEGFQDELLQVFGPFEVGEQIVEFEFEHFIVERLLGFVYGFY